MCGGGAKSNAQTDYYSPTTQETNKTTSTQEWLSIEEHLHIVQSIIMRYMQ
jgi:hypothetical protein